MSKIVSLDERRERKRYLSPSEIEALVGHELPPTFRIDKVTAEDLEKMLAETYEMPVCLRP